MTFNSGADLSLQVSVFDLHDGAYYAWRAAASPPRPLVHLDAHHDLEPIGSDGIHIGNFVRAAILERLVSQVFWVVPDPVWRSAPGQAVLARELRAMADRRPSGWSASVEGIPVVVCAWAELPEIRGPALLDIDVDYLTVSERGRDADDTTGTPWIWPDALARAIQTRKLRHELVTIATSVSGGFIPIEWKHLAHELAMRLGGPPHDARALDAYALIAHAATREPAAALAELRRCATRHPGCAPVWFHLANELLEAEHVEEARAAFVRALALDPGYRHPYRSRGPREQAAGRFSHARAEYERVRLLDPADPFCRIGLAQLAEREQHGDQARVLFEEALALPGGEIIEACRGLARVQEASCPRAAIRLYERSLKLALAGQVPLSAPLCTNDEHRVRDPGHCETYGRIGRLLHRIGDDKTAAVNYVLAAGAEPKYRVQLGWLRMRRGRLRGVWDCVAGAAAWLARAASGAAGRSARAWYNPGPP